jgi:ATP-dependent Clp protease ATP-binding subunit ClpC
LANHDIWPIISPDIPILCTQEKRVSDRPIKRLTTAAQRIGEAALQLQTEAKHEQLGLHHWLLAVLERHGAMVEGMLPGFKLEETKKELRTRLAKNETGMVLDEAAAVAQAAAFARQRNKSQAAERDLAAVVLILAGYIPAQTLSGAAASNLTNTEGAPAAPGSLPTPTLDKYGSDLTQKAREGKLPPLIGREEELQLMIETLCRRTKRNPVLIGPAGVGKTAIVEGLAQRIVEGKVPTLLKDVRIVALQPSNLVAGSEMRGDFEKRMQSLMQEASQPGLILFIDEIQSMMGAGGSSGSTDFASILKPTLARGDLAVIAATTDAEHRRFITEDAALERRFQPIRVQELTAEQTYQVLVGLRGVLVKRYNIQAPDEVLRWLIKFANQYMHNRFFPDKAVDLLEQSYAHAAVSDKTTVELNDAQDVAQRMVGMPLDLDTRISTLQRLLGEDSGLVPEQIETLSNRLRVTLRGMDLRSARPNATVLLCGAAAEQAGQLAASCSARTSTCWSARPPATSAMMTPCRCTAWRKCRGACWCLTPSTPAIPARAACWPNPFPTASSSTGTANRCISATRSF